jgi:transcriptional regulator with XRE-family HTH domain
MSFADQIKSERQRLGLTQAEAAALLGIDPRTLWKWESADPPLLLTQEGALNRLSSAGRAAGAGGVRDTRRAKKRRGS